MLNRLLSRATAVLVFAMLLSPVAIAGFTVPPTQVPLPATLILLVTGLVALVYQQRK